MTPLGEWESMLETNTELENAQVFGRNQELSRGVALKGHGPSRLRKENT